jgi:hypothetical protein
LNAICADDCAWHRSSLELDPEPELEPDPEHDPDPELGESAAIASFVPLVFKLPLLVV